APILHRRGPTVISGVAWSGRGSIPRVDVSLNGGKDWIEARMSGPSHDKSMHRFYHEFDWDGSPLLLQSRAHDSTGYVQPTKNELRAVRGENSIYHNNGIQTWYIDEKGNAENVEVS
ncbi:MAG: sulfite dehydrogenase, partial [Rhodobacteraceae bacterium]